ncbi:Dnaja4 [Symbiodinium sp. KB8]|nr:Dnaja4 [Symbiodinium sp. KB8]
MEVSRGEGEPLDFHVKYPSPAAHGAYLRAVSGDCEVYRVWQYDLLQAAHVVPQAHDWFYQLRVLEKETRAWLETRLVSARGQLLGRVPGVPSRGSGPGFGSVACVLGPEGSRVGGLKESRC